MEIRETSFYQSGFTLVEVVIVIFLFSLLSIVSTSFLFTTLKSTTKSNIEKELKQNGDYALNSMERLIRNAKLVSPCQAGLPSLTLENQNGSTTVLQCLDQDGVAKIASQSGSIIGALTSTVGTIANPGSNCSTSSTLVFDCSGTAPQSVTVSFTLKQTTAGVRAEEQASLSFQSTVGLRNY